MSRRLRVTFSVRAVIARECPFVAHGETYADAGVALDEIATLPSSREPMVLRVKAAGGMSSERALVQDDWLCEAGSIAPRRLPRPRWVYNMTAQRWANRRGWLEAWDTCEDPRWMVGALCDVGVERASLIGGVIDCVRLVEPLLGDDDAESRDTLGRIERGTTPEAEPADPLDSSAALVNAIMAETVGASTPSQIEARFAVAYLTRAVAAAPREEAPVSSSALTTALDAASSAILLAAPTTPKRASIYRDFADRIRARVPTLAVLRGLVARG